MPKTIAQWTGVAVTMIVVLGRDADVLTAVPLGIVAGLLATLFQATIRLQVRPVRLPIDLRRPLTVAMRAVQTYRPKWRHAQFRE